MPENHTDSSELNTSTENPLNKSSQKKSLYDHLNEEDKRSPMALIPGDEVCDKNITDPEFRAFSFISLYAGGRGVCFASNEELEQKAEWFRIRNFQRHCQSLEEKKFLYRVQIQKPEGGSKRFLVPKTFWQKYRNYLIKRGFIKNAMHVESFFTGIPEDLLLMQYNERKKYEKPENPSPTGADTTLSVASKFDTTLSVASNTPLKDNAKKQEQAGKPQPPKNPPSKSTTPFAAASASLIKKGMGKEDVIMLEKIYKLRKAKVDAARNPPGLLLDLFAREDVRLEVLEEEAAAAEQNKSARIVTDNTGVAKAVFEELLAADPEEQVYTIRLRDNNIQISFRGGGAETLCFYEKNFIKGLDRVRVGALQRVEAYNANL